MLYPELCRGAAPSSPAPSFVEGVTAKDADRPVRRGKNNAPARRYSLGLPANRSIFHKLNPATPTIETQRSDPSPAGYASALDARQDSIPILWEHVPPKLVRPLHLRRHATCGTAWYRRRNIALTGFPSRTYLPQKRAKSAKINYVGSA
jgi:hypothetical protein